MDCMNVIVGGEGGHDRMMREWFGGMLEMTLRTVELIIDGALNASARKNNLVQQYMKEKLSPASKQFLTGLMVVWMQRQSPVCL